MSPEDIMAAEGWSREEYDDYADALYELAGVPVVTLHRRAGLASSLALGEGREAA